MKKEDFDYLIGKKVDSITLPDDYFIFQSKIDGDRKFKTMDFDPYRINVEVENGIITKVINLE